MLAASDWLPDETLYSLVSRCHLVSGAVRDAITNQRFFGHSHLGNSHDFPGRLDTFVERTKACFGNAEAILWQRTLLPYYLAGRPEQVRHREVAFARSASVGQAKARLGLLAAKLGANHPLKFCPECVTKDTVDFGVAYWHRAHQWPGVWICPHHHRPLRVSTVRSPATGANAWDLPSISNAISNESIALTECELRTLIRLAETTQHWIDSTRDQPIDVDAAAAIYSRCLSDQLDGPGKQSAKRLDLLRHATTPYVQALAHFPGHEMLCGDAGLRLFQRCLSQVNASHPLRHIILIAALFEDFEDFLSKVADLGSASTAVIASAPEPDTANAESNLRNQVLSTVMQGASPRDAAMAHGVGESIVRTWITQAGLERQRRRSKFAQELDAKSIQLLKAGKNQHEVVVETGLSRRRVNYLVQTTVGLATEWRKARFELQRTEAQSSWMRTVETMSGASLSTMRLSDSGAFEWLKRNDPEWLSLFNEGVKRQRPIRKPVIRWDHRDYELSIQILRAIDRLCQGADRKSTTLADIHLEVPELRRHLPRLHMLPLTQQALEHSAIRRRASRY